jgi:hypothetical protein
LSRLEHTRFIVQSALDVVVSDAYGRIIERGTRRPSGPSVGRASRSSALSWRAGTRISVNGSGLGATHIVYGRVPARQNVRVGSLADGLVVTVDF